MKKLIFFFLLLSLNSFGQQLRVYKEKGVWKYDQTGPLNTYPIDGGIISDTAAIPDPLVVTTPPPRPIQEPFKVLDVKKIDARDYDKGGATVAYLDTDGINQGITTYRLDANDIEGTNVGWFYDGDYYEYTAVFPAGPQQFYIAASAINPGSSVAILIDGAQVGVMDIPKTSNWTSYITTTGFTTTTTAGKKVIQVKAVRGNFNVENFGFGKPTVTPPPTGSIINISPGQNIPTNSPAGTTIKLSAGTWTQGILNIPSGVFVEGSGPGQTIIKGSVRTQSTNSSNFLFNFKGGSGGGIKNLTIDGDNKTLNGAILMDDRDNFTVENVEVLRTYFCGIWVLNSNNVTIKNPKLLNCSWGSTAWCSGNLQFGNCTNLEISGFDISEERGYGMKSLGHTNKSPLTNVKIHDGRISVNPRGAWNDGKAPNITLEIWASSFPGSEIYNCYFDNTVSLVNDHTDDRGPKLKVYNNTFDINGPRAGGYGYSIELSINDAEVYGNKFIGGSTAMVNWHIKQCKGWDIHHNYFYNIGRMINSQSKGVKGGGLKDVTITNNTAEMDAGVTAFLELNASNGENIKIKNNLFIGTGGRPAIVSTVSGATMVNSEVSNNFFSGNLNTGVSGVTLKDNLTGDPMINKSGSKTADQYYKPLPGSPLISKDIGAFK